MALEFIPDLQLQASIFLPLHEAIDEWYTSTCLWCWNLFKVQWLGIHFSAIFFIKSVYIYIILFIYLFTRGILQVTYKEMTLHQRTNLTALEH